MAPKKKHRLSGPAVVIGYLFLIPSVCGMLIGALLLFGSGTAATEVAGAAKEALRQDLAKASIPADITTLVTNHETVPQERLNRLTPRQRHAISIARMNYSAGVVGAGAGTAIAGGLAIFMIMSSFVGGLLGWILTMKKKVLQCSVCGAVVGAS